MLTEAQKEAIVRRARNNENQNAIAASYGVSRSRVSQIARAAGVFATPGFNHPDNKGEKHHRWTGGTRLIKGYRVRYAPSHPRNIRGYVYEHILIVEKAMGKPLPPLAEVHHANGRRADNRPENLVVCQDRAYHMLIHQRMRAAKACGKPSWRKCSFCKAFDAPECLVIPQRGGGCYHRECAARYQYARKRIRALATLLDDPWTWEDDTSVEGDAAP